MCICQIGVLHVAHLGIEDRLCHIILSLSPSQQVQDAIPSCFDPHISLYRAAFDKIYYHLHEKKHITV